MPSAENTSPEASSMSWALTDFLILLISGFTTSHSLIPGGHSQFESERAVDFILTSRVDAQRRKHEPRSILNELGAHGFSNPAHFGIHHLSLTNTRGPCSVCERESCGFYFDI